ncbi:MAG TPA: formate/nitrite transporter family protein [Pyrinomonadaceae bacterium]|nr:formate/nitrite transporter family protein [Pyrinomonadaceae bacterium]
MSEPKKQREQQDEEQHNQDVEQQEVEERSAPSGKVVYKAILKEGEGELERSSSALFWSGLAAGLSMGFSLVAEGLLMTYLPDAHWRPLVAKFGYSIGFLIVILGRQQLFTENTLTPMLPLLKRKDGKTLLNVARLWAVVLVANLLGALLFAWAAARTTAFDPEIQKSFSELGHKAMEPGALTILWRGVFAGWLIALMVWLLPFAETARVWVIIIITYVVGLGHLSHIIAGSIEVFAIAAMNQASWLTVISHYILPTLLGNIIGGVTLVAALNHAQVVAGGGGEDI